MGTSGKKLGFGRIFDKVLDAALSQVQLVHRAEQPGGIGWTLKEVGGFVSVGGHAQSIPPGRLRRVALGGGQLVLKTRLA